MTVAVYLRDRFFILACLLALPVWLLIYFTPILSWTGNSFTWFQVVALVLLFPVLEELVFRGLIQGSLLRVPLLAKRPLLFSNANAITSLLFAALHLIHQPIAMAALIFIPSLVFGELRDRFGSTRPSIVMHVFYNLGLLLVLMSKSI